MVRLGDVARVELGAETYGIASLFNGYPAAGIPIMLAPGANALKTVDAVKAKAEELRAQLPPGMKMVYPIDNTTFIRLSIHDVVVTLMEAIALVVLVMYIFLQNWRATLIPAIAVPVVLLGTFGVLADRRLFHQHADPVRAGAGDRPSGRRRHRGGGECRAHHA